METQRQDPDWYTDPFEGCHEDEDYRGWGEERGMEDMAEARFLRALDDFVRAGRRLVETWDDEDFHADERFPLPKELAPPMSLDEWLEELSAHYHGERA